MDLKGVRTLALGFSLFFNLPLRDPQPSLCCVAYVHFPYCGFL